MSLHAAHIWGLRSYAPPPQGVLVYRVWQHEGHEGLWQDLWKWRASLVAQMVKNPPEMWQTWVWSLCWESSLEKWSEVAQSCLTLCNPMDCSLPGSTIDGIFQARILEWVAISFFRRSSWPRDWTWVSHMVGIVGRRFTIWATREDPFPGKGNGHRLQYSGLENSMERGA